MSYNIVPSTRFKKSLKKYLKIPSKKEAIKSTINLLADGGYKTIPATMLPHKLKGNYNGLGMSYFARSSPYMATRRKTREGNSAN